MELIPILSLIVLVATISTFILAVGAYVLYKVRERKGRVANAPKPESIEAELVAPTPIMAEQRQTQAPQPMMARTAYPSGSARPTASYPHVTSTGQTIRRTAPLRPTFVEPEELRHTQAESHESSKKYMRYTKEGYVEPKTTKVKKEDKLQWR